MKLASREFPLEYWGGSSMREHRGETERKQEAECGMFMAEKARAAVKDGACESILMPFHIKHQADEVEMQTEKKRKTTGLNDGLNVQ